MNTRLASLIGFAVAMGGLLPTAAHANRIVQEWACVSNGQYGLEIPVQGEARSYLRDARVPVQITLRESSSRPGFTVEMKFGGQPYLANFGHAFIEDSGSTVA